MSSLPPQLARKVTIQMYMPHISKMPMFKNLGIELLAMICGVVEHLDIAKDNGRRVGGGVIRAPPCALPPRLVSVENDFGRNIFAST